jgi:hypothetical protein
MRVTQNVVTLAQAVDPGQGGPRLQRRYDDDLIDGQPAWYSIAQQIRLSMDSGPGSADRAIAADDGVAGWGIRNQVRSRELAVHSDPHLSVNRVATTVHPRARRDLGTAGLH